MSKYKNKKVEVDGYLFDSLIEHKYYEQLKWLKEGGEIAAFSVQPRYLLQDKFKKGEKTHRKIEYVADFEVLHHDGGIEVIDIKGVSTPVFALKRKLFEARYPHSLSVIAYSEIDGGWIHLDQLVKNRAKRKKEREKVK